MLPNKDLLTPGPWIVNGNTIKDSQGRTIAVCFARNATAHAYWVAALPQFAASMGGGIEAHEDEVALLRDEVRTLRRENVKLHEDADGIIDQYELDALEHQNGQLRDRVAQLEAQVESLRNQAVG